MPSPNSILDQIVRDKEIAERILNETALPPDKAGLKEDVLEDFTQLRRLVEYVVEDPHGRNEIKLMAGQLLMAVHSVTETGDTDILEHEESFVREKIRRLFE